MPNIWNGTRFGDLDRPLNASRGLSAIAELSVLRFAGSGNKELDRGSNVHM